MMNSKSIDVFFEILRAGLWDKEVKLSKFGQLGFDEIYRLASEQSVVGLIAAGLEKVADVKVSQPLALSIAGDVLQLEQQNKAMNQFIGALVTDMRKQGIYTLLVKGQGVAQCYNKPLWRASGDIDFYLSDDSFENAKRFFRPKVESFDPDNEFSRHINMHYGQWVVEIHANQFVTLSSKINEVLKDIHEDLFNNGNVRSWMDGNTQVFLPSANNDAVLIFTHFLSHFYKGGIGLRQICDWCRLLWTYRESLDYELLEKRIRKAGLLTEWRAFGAFAVEYLGIPTEAMPMYDSLLMGHGSRFAKKADRICDFILEVGNFGHNRDTSYYSKYPFVVRKAISAWWRVKDLCRHAKLFPLDSLRFFPHIIFNGFRSVAHGE